MTIKEILWCGNVERFKFAFSRHLHYHRNICGKLINYLCHWWQREGIILAEIRVGKNETLDTALKRFKRSCARDGVIAEVRKREHYEKPSVKRKKKSEAARKRKY